jgi:hypothetical protein
MAESTAMPSPKKGDGITMKPAKPGAYIRTGMEDAESLLVKGESGTATDKG